MRHKLKENIMRQWYLREKIWMYFFFSTHNHDEYQLIIVFEIQSKALLGNNSGTQKWKEVIEFFIYYKYL